MAKRTVIENILSAYFNGLDILETSQSLKIPVPEIKAALRDLLIGNLEESESQGELLLTPSARTQEASASMSDELSVAPALVSLTPAPVEKGLVLRVDGGARHNPGPAAYGVVVYLDGVKRKEWGAYLGITTNNIAEYKGLIAALEFVLNLKTHKKVLIESDSLLVVQQFKGEFKVKDPKLIPLHMDAKMLAQRIGEVEVRYIPREQNTDADGMVNKTLDEAIKNRL